MCSLSAKAGVTAALEAWWWLVGCVVTKWSLCANSSLKCAAVSRPRASILASLSEADLLLLLGSAFDVNGNIVIFLVCFASMLTLSNRRPHDVTSPKEVVAAGALLLHLIIHPISFRNRSLGRVRHIVQLPTNSLICKQSQFMSRSLIVVALHQSSVISCSLGPHKKTSHSQTWHPGILDCICWIKDLMGEPGTVRETVQKWEWLLHQEGREAGWRAWEEQLPEVIPHATRLAKCRPMHSSRCWNHHAQLNWQASRPCSSYFKWDVHTHAFLEYGPLGMVVWLRGVFVEKSNSLNHWINDWILKF